MLDNYFSLFEVKEIDKENCTITLFDLLGKQNFTLLDIGISQTGNVGTILTVRLIPIEGVYINSGLALPFEENKRMRLLTEISRRSRKSNRKRSIKIKASKKTSTTLLEIMFGAYKKWGIETLTFEH